MEPIDGRCQSVCFIGAGPCTLSALHFFKQMPTEEQEQWEVVVYEKQSAIGGMWQQEGNWRVGTSSMEFNSFCLTRVLGVDEYGMPTHHSMYRDLWSNGPKEALELPDWTFRDCFGENIPSFPPRCILAVQLYTEPAHQRRNIL